MYTLETLNYKVSVSYGFYMDIIQVFDFEYDYQKEGILNNNKIHRIL